jgi:hypothetical protein
LCIHRESFQAANCAVGQASASHAIRYGPATFDNQPALRIESLYGPQVDLSFYTPSVMYASPASNRLSWDVGRQIQCHHRFGASVTEPEPEAATLGRPVRF